MKTKREVAEIQIGLQEELQKAGYNVVSCCNCDTVLIHREGDETAECLCGTIYVNDCTDLWYEGCQENEEFNGYQG